MSDYAQAIERIRELEAELEAVTAERDALRPKVDPKPAPAAPTAS